MPWIQPFTTPIFPSAPMSFKLSLLFRISGYNFVRISHIYYACYMSQPSHPPLFITLIIFSGQYNLWSSSAPKCPDHLYSPPSFLFKGHRGSFLGVKRSECKVYHLLHLVTRLGIGGAIPLLPLYVYMMWTGSASRCWINYAAMLSYLYHALRIGNPATLSSGLYFSVGSASTEPDIGLSYHC